VVTESKPKCSSASQDERLDDRSRGRSLLYEASPGAKQARPGRSAQAIGVSERNDFARGTDLDYRVLNDQELAAIIDKLPKRPLRTRRESGSASPAPNVRSVAGR